MYAGTSCEGSTIAIGDILLFSTPFSNSRSNMTVFTSTDGGRTYPHVLEQVDIGASAYSALFVLNASHAGLIYECCGYGQLVFRVVVVRGM
jgi:hypothetical protein